MLWVYFQASDLRVLIESLRYGLSTANWSALVLIFTCSSSVSASHAAGASGPVNSSDSGLDRKDRRLLYDIKQYGFFYDNEENGFDRSIIRFGGQLPRKDGLNHFIVTRDSFNDTSSTDFLNKVISFCINTFSL